MVQLVAYTQIGGNPTYLDLGDVSIKATYSSKEIQDVTKQKSDFTHNITLPFSQINNDFFAHYYEVNVDGSYRADIKAACSIYVDSNLTFEGYIQLLKVDTLNENYTAICFGDVANLATELGEAKLNDLDLSKYNHILSQANIENGWNGLTEYTGTLADGDEILYPIIDNGIGYDGDTLNTNAGAIKPSDLKPSIKVKTLLDEIVSNAGYTISSSFLNTDAFTKQYMTLGGDLEGSAVGFYDAFKVGISADQDITELGTIELDDDTSTGFFNLNNNFNLAGFKYVAPQTGTYEFTAQMVIDTIVHDAVILVFISINNVIDVTSPLLVGINPTTTGLDVFSSNGVSIPLQINDEVRLFTTALNVTFGQKIIKPIANVGGHNYRTFFKLSFTPPEYEGGTVNFEAGNNLLPKDKQIDFVKSILSRYNLIAEVDKDTPKQLNIEPIQNFRDAGVSKDWTDKLDASKSVVIEPTNRFRKDELNLTDKDDKDKINNWWQTKNSQAYNSYKFPFYGDFGSGTLEVPSIFSSFAPERINNNRMFIAKHFEYNEGVAKSVKVKPKLFYYSGTKYLPPASGYKILNAVTGNYTTKAGYPFCHHYLMAGNNYVTSTDTDLRFRSGSVLNETDLVETQTINDTYSLYWSKYLNNIYNKEARMQTAYFNLTAKDISEFKYNDKIFVKDSYWFINKISSYAMGMYNSTKVELIKIVEGTSSEVCNLTMTTSNLDGSTNWVDSDGVATAPTAECCNEKNLTFINNTCRWKNR
jgi:hypothetical protein